MLRAGQFQLSYVGQLDIPGRVIPVVLRRTTGCSRPANSSCPAQDNWMLRAGNYFPNIIHTASFVMGSHVGTRTREHESGQARHPAHPEPEAQPP